MEQTFAWFDLSRVFFLTFLELLLSADNALVLALLVRSLPESLQRKALFIGSFSSLIFRGLGLLCIAMLIRYAWIQMIAAIYLIYLALHYFFGNRSKSPFSLHPTRSFWKTVFLIEVFDLAFAVDSIVAAVAFIGPNPHPHQIHPKLWIAYMGGLFGLIGVRFAAKVFGLWVERFPYLDRTAHLLVGWIGFKLLTQVVEQAISLPNALAKSIDYVFWGILVIFVASGFIKKGIFKK